MITLNEILSDIYLHLSPAAFAGISGKVYKNTRPTNSTLEDCVIRIMHGITGKQTQRHALTIQLFFKAHSASNTITPDTVREQALHKMLIDASISLNSLQGYMFSLDSREIYTEQVGSEPLFYAILRINFFINK